MNINNNNRTDIDHLFYLNNSTNNDAIYVENGCTRLKDTVIFNHTNDSTHSSF